MMSRVQGIRVAHRAMVMLCTPHRNTRSAYGTQYVSAVSRAIEAAADGCGSDVAGLAFWWSNCLHLRWMLWAMSRGEGEGTLDEFDWVMQARSRGQPTQLRAT